MFIHKFDALQARELGLLWRTEHCTPLMKHYPWYESVLESFRMMAVDSHWKSSWMCSAPCHKPCWGSFYISRMFYCVCMTKLRPGVRLSGARLRARVAAYQYLLVSPNITHNCVGNDSSYSFPVRCFGQPSRLCLLNWSPYGGLLNWYVFPSSPRVSF